MESGIGDRPRSASAASTTSLLTIQDLSVDIIADGKAQPVLRSIALHIGEGETLGLVGESGSGKSLTALAIMGLLPPAAQVTTGRVQLAETELLSLPPKAINDHRGKDMAMVFQEPMTALNPVFTVGDQIAEIYLQRQRDDRSTAWQKAVSMMERVGIADAKRRAGSYPHQLSGGMRQRVMIAMAMALRPKLLICDEPTTALDVTVQAQILDLILDLQVESGMGVLFITHDLGVVSEVADRVAVIYAGGIIETAQANDFFAAPKHPYAKALLSSLPGGVKPGEQLATIPGQVPAPGDLITGCRFHPRCPSVLERCRKDQPMMTEHDRDHLSACWLETSS